MRSVASLVATAMLIQLAGCRPTAASSAPIPRRGEAQPPKPDSVRVWARLDSGALVRVHLSGNEIVIGRLLVPFAFRRRLLAEHESTEELVLCDRRREPCTAVDTGGVRHLATSKITRLDVRGTMGQLALLGFYAGSLVAMFVNGAAKKDEDGSKTVAAIFVGGGSGALLVGAIGSRIVGWNLVFPCVHMCASGEYH